MLLLAMIYNLLIVAGSYPVEIIFKNPEYKTQCEKDLRNGTDSYVITVTFGPNVTANQEDNFKHNAAIQMLTSTDVQFVDMCTVSFGPKGSHCGISDSTTRCNCDLIDAHGAAHVKVKSVAYLSHSKGIIRGEWQNNNGTSFHSDNLTLPHIYDVNNATMTLKVNDNPAVILSNSCSITFTSSEITTLELCCSEAASPCYPVMSFSDGVEVATQSKCVKRTFTSVSESFTENVTTAYSVCTVDRFITKGYCLIYTKPPEPSIVTFVLIIVGVFVIVGGAAVAVLSLKKGGHRKKVTVTTDASASDDSQEQDKKTSVSSTRTTQDTERSGATNSAVNS